MGARGRFSGAGVLFFFKNFKKKKKKIQNRFKKVITFPKRHADNSLEIFPIVKTSYAFWSWICLWRFFDKIRKFPVRNPCRRQGSLLIALIKSILSGGPSRRQLYPSRWYRFFFFSKKKL